VAAVAALGDLDSTNVLNAVTMLHNFCFSVILFFAWVPLVRSESGRLLVRVQHGRFGVDGLLARIEWGSDTGGSSAPPLAGGSRLRLARGDTFINS